ncbi:MAG: rane-associated, metal-dependent hydrolase, partial [Pseudomonadota bacterium]
MKSTRKRSLLDKFYNKISKIHLYYDSVLSSFFFASILILWSNSFAVARLVMQYITLEGYLVGTMHIIGVLILAILILFILLYICSLFSQKLFRLTTFILLSICGSYNYFVYKNNFIFNESMVESIILAGWDDATAVYGHDIILFLTIFIGSPAIKLFFLKVKKSTLMQSTFKFSKFCIILSGLILILNHQSLKHPKTLLTARNNLMPFPLLYPSHDLKRRTQHAWDLRFKNASEGRLNDYEGINFTKTKNNTEPVIAIFLIGESTRSDRLSINGYEKETTPLMQKTPNLFAFKDVLTCGIVTSDSVPCMLTDISSHNFQNHHVKVVDRTSLASPLTKVGFDSYW